MANSWSALEAQMKAALCKSVSEATTKSHQELQENVDRFYDSPEGMYKRTGMFRASPQNDGVSSSGTTAIGQISINTGTQYVPAGRDTETIYGYAENGGLLGQGGVWRDTKEEIPKILSECISHNFK